MQPMQIQSYVHLSAEVETDQGEVQHCYNRVGVTQSANGGSRAIEGGAREGAWTINWLTSIYVYHRRSTVDIKQREGYLVLCWIYSALY